MHLLIHYGGPTKLKHSGKSRVLACSRKRATKDTEALVDSIFAALAAQTVTVPGTAAAEIATPMLTTNIKALKTQRDSIAAQVEEMLDDFPLA
nr:hypothetical protein [Corynebacterium sp. CNJ-954]